MIGDRIEPERVRGCIRTVSVTYRNRFITVTVTVPYRCGAVRYGYGHTHDTVRCDSKVLILYCIGDFGLIDLFLGLFQTWIGKMR